MPRWPGKAPGAVPIAGPEGTTTVQNPGDPPATVVGRVSRPTMTVYSPKGKNTGAAVVVFPGVGIGFCIWILRARRSVTG